MAWQMPKTDWTKDNYYSFDDLNRVESNTQELAKMLLASLGMTAAIDSVITNRDMASIEFSDSLNRIENNILTITNAVYTPGGWITPVTNWAPLQPFGYKDANRLEGNLQELYILINNIIASLQYCGVVTCGQDASYL